MHIKSNWWIKVSDKMNINSRQLDGTHQTFSLISRHTHTHSVTLVFVCQAKRIRHIFCFAILNSLFNPARLPIALFLRTSIHETKKKPVKIVYKMNNWFSIVKLGNAFFLSLAVRSLNQPLVLHWQTSKSDDNQLKTSHGSQQKTRNFCLVFAW